METPENIFYDPDQRKKQTHRNLPHWQQYGKMYFITFRLADSIPKQQLTQLQEERQRWLENHTEPYSPEEKRQYRRLFTQRIEKWLDDCHGSCLLAKSQCAEIVRQTLAYFDSERYILDSWVIMPNHVHVLSILLDCFTLSDILHSWKSYSAQKINNSLNLTGQVWQHESFDHIVRSDRHLEKYRSYILENKAKAGERAMCAVAQASLLEHEGD
jgi:REP element-mobilizing transposase RayT